MKSLSASDILRIWEAGEGQSPVGKVLAILKVALPDRSAAALAELRLAESDRMLLAIREQVYGTQLDCYSECPHCAERLEYGLSTDGLRARLKVEEVLAWWELEAGGAALRVRAPVLGDLAAVQSQPAAAARSQLAARCVLGGGESLLPEGAVEEVAQLLAREDESELLVDLVCPSCGHRWQLVLDIGSFLWTELSVQASHLLREVHALARAYGWSESEILAMSAVRRRAYLELVGRWGTTSAG